MLVAKQKRKENIAEYILYLYQIEDLIRAFRFDIQLIEEKLVAAYKTDKKTKAEISDWYSNLVAMMQKEQITEKGHLQFLSNLIDDLNEFHLKLMQTGKSVQYVNVFQAISGLLTELKQKNSTARNDIHLALDTIYGFLILKMKRAEISAGTMEAIKRLGQWLGSLSNLYKDYESGALDFEFR